MIYLVEKNNGEQWEDYYSWIDSVWQLNEIQDIENSYKQHIMSVCLEHNITINPHWLNIMNESKCKNKTLHKKILKTHTIEKFLESLGAIKLEFKELSL